ncbi:CLUMA_CG020122, isoform A [Clunio marinus]|uniref:Pyruvate dehydrogenase E1 component subunit alpha n=1 Tax=Clunio marinus TaxID=568069 RepID=A0A1J1J3Z7_9DIPT|nr:CLUMA_CG020122, isoform A [Clunio marinus]
MLRKCFTIQSQNLFNNLKVSSTVTKKYFSSEVQFETKDFKLHKLNDGPKTNVTVNREDALNYYRQMLSVRRLEAASGAMYKEKQIRGFCHLYSGQEACAVGMKAALRPHDDVITAYRCHGWTYLMGASIASVLCELTGHIEGVSRGKGGSMHLYAPNFYGGNGIVGAQVPLGVGIGFASKYKGTDGICVALYGDGAANQGQIFEVYNMSKLWGTPVIFVCENNGYGMGTSAERASANIEYYTRGDFIPGIWVDGMDVLAVREATRFAVDHAANGKGPILLEMATYRYSGHSMSDPGTSYRSRDEIQEVRQTRDPITSLKEKILTSGMATEAEIKAIDTEVKKEVDEATKKARSDPGIKVEELTYDIYANDENLKLVRNVIPNAELPHKRFNTARNL